MAKKRASTDASYSALGYLYQCRYALLLFLTREEASTHSISIEKLDDVSIVLPKRNDGITLDQLYQLKHRSKRSGGTSNGNVEIWKTLKIWAQAIQDNKVDLEGVEFFMITTSIASQSHAISKLRKDQYRNPEAARHALELAGNKSKNKTVISAFSVLKKLSIEKRKQLFSVIYLIEKSPNVEEVRDRLKNALWTAVNANDADEFVDRLEGWWFNKVIEHLLDPMSYHIDGKLIRDQIHSLRDEFKSSNLPADFLSEDVPSDKMPDIDPRLFVKQLEIIKIGRNRIRKAQENHYRAASQRAKWLRSQLVNISELEKFEKRLEQEWDELYQIMLDSLDDDANEGQLTKSARDLYDWSQKDAPHARSLYIRPNFQSPYLMRGTYQMLADELRVGWHRDFKDQFGAT